MIAGPQRRLSTKNWCFQIVVLEKTLESPLDCEEIKPVNPKGNQPWIFVRRTDVEAEAPILWSPDMRSHAWVCATLLQSCPTLCDPMDYSPPGPSVHGILQARILEWVAIPFSRRSSQLRYWTRVYLYSRRILYHLSHQGIPKPLYSKRYTESWSQRTRAQLERPFHEKAMVELPSSPEELV